MAGADDVYIEPGARAPRVWSIAGVTFLFFLSQAVVSYPLMTSSRTWYRSSRRRVANASAPIRRERFREREHRDEQRSAIGQRVELLIIGGEQHRRRGGIHHLERMRPEGHQTAGRTTNRGPLAESSQDVAVAEVDAVEGADGDDGAAGELRKSVGLGRPVTHRAGPAAGIVAHRPDRRRRR